MHGRTMWRGARYSGLVIVITREYNVLVYSNSLIIIYIIIMYWRNTLVVYYRWQMALCANISDFNVDKSRIKLWRKNLMEKLLLLLILKNIIYSKHYIILAKIAKRVIDWPYIWSSNYYSQLPNSKVYLLTPISQ